MIKFQILSDTHIENYKYEHVKIDKFITPVADILILAGDIGRVCKFTQLENFLKDLCAIFKQVIYVLGNSEFYTGSKANPSGSKANPSGSKGDTLNLNMDECVSKLKNIGIPNLHVLDRDIVIINNVCIAGCTLWSNINGYKRDAVKTPSFIKIKDMSISLYKALHQRDLEFVKETIAYCKKNNYKLLMITHYPPTEKVWGCMEDKERCKKTFAKTFVKTFVKPFSKEEEYRCFYASKLDWLYKHDKHGVGGIHTWVYGHVHNNSDFTEHECRFVSNQSGKKRDRAPGFVKDKVIFI